MAIYNLGTVSRKQSSLSGLSDALATGMKLGEQARSNRANEALQKEQNDIAKENASLRAQEVQMEKSRLASQLAKQKADEAEKNRENTTKAVEQLSMYLNDKTAGEIEIFKTTDHYKELQKLVKKYAPEYINEDTGDIVLMQNRDIYATQLEKIKATNAQILQNGGELTPGQQKAQDLLDQVEPKVLAAALDVTSQNFFPDPKSKLSPQQQFSQEVARNIQSIMEGRGAFKGMQSGVNPSDPLNIFSNALGGM